MNSIHFEEDIGVFINQQYINASNTPEWKQLCEELGPKATFTITNEIPLNGNVDELDKLRVFKIPFVAGKDLIQQGKLSSRIYAWRLLGSIFHATGVKFTQGCLPATLKSKELAVLVYLPKNNDPLGFTIAYGIQEQPDEDISAE